MRRISTFGARPRPSGDVRRVRRNAVAVGLATGAYGLSFGALGVAAHLSVAQTCVLSLVLFSGASQFAYVGAVAHPLAASFSALLLGLRNGLYSLRNRPLLGPRGIRRLLAAQLTIDESTAMAAAEADPALARVGFWWAGGAVYVLWNLGTALGAVGAAHLGSPQRLGLDAAEPAAFLGLLAPRLDSRRAAAVALAGAGLALALVAITPAGVSILAAAAVAVAAGWRDRRAPTAPARPRRSRPLPPPPAGAAS